MSLFGAGHDLAPVSPSVNQRSPVVTANSFGFTAAWIESGQGRNAIVARAVGADGEPIGASIEESSPSYLQSIAIAHSPSDTLIAWITGTNAFAKRLPASGAPSNTIALTSGNAYPSDIAVAWNGSRYFAVWSNGFQLLGTFVAPDGTPTMPRAFFSEPPVNGHFAPEYYAVQPDVAWDGRNFIIVFGEAPNIPCIISPCPPPLPDHSRVMRVSANGDAIDSSPLTISGPHYIAHVASSGAESLIALDNGSQLSTIVVHDDSGLTLDAETSLFRWFTYLSSAVAWDGATYTVGWRYAGAESTWLGAAHVTRSGSPLDYRFVTTAPAPLERPSIAVAESGITAFAISESSGPASAARARLYLASELNPMPAPPPPPKNVISAFGGQTARIDWQQSETPAGFAIERSWDFGVHWGLYSKVAGDQRTVSVYANVGNLFRVRAFGPGGVSEGTITSIGSQQRRHAARQ